MLLQIENLNAGYGRKVVLSGVNLAFEGGAAGLLGPNGAGKSTLLKTILGFLPPLSGSVRFEGHELPSEAIAVRARIGYMPEQEAFIPGMSAVRFVAYMAELSGLPRAAAVERSHECLQYVGLGEARYRNLETYSLGMKQRAKLAQAIVHDPQLLLLDEPTNGLDPAGRLEMLDLVRDLSQNKGMAVVLCSHLLGDVETVANEIIVLGGGRVASRRLADPAARAAEAAAPKAYHVRVRGDRAAFTSVLPQFGLRLLPPRDNTRTGADLLIAQIPATTRLGARDSNRMSYSADDSDYSTMSQAETRVVSRDEVLARIAATHANMQETDSSARTPAATPDPVNGGTSAYAMAIYRAAQETNCLIQRLEPVTEKLQDLYVDASRELGTRTTARPH